MNTYRLLFWSRRSDEDDPSEPLCDASADDLVRSVRETGRKRDMDGEEFNRWAPWHDVEVVAEVDATSEEEAWRRLRRHILVVEERFVVVMKGADKPT